MRFARVLCVTAVLGMSAGVPARARAGDAAANLAHADSAYAAGREDDARAAYALVLADDPASVRANHRLGLLLSRADRLDSALVLLARARAVEPNDEGLLGDEARLLSWAGRLRESLADYDALVALDPESRDARLGRARVLGWAGRYAAADSAYATLLAAKAEDAAALTGRAQNALWRGQSALAEAHFLAATRVDRDNVDALLGLARLRHDQGRQRSAAEQVSHALSVAPESRAALNLGRQIRAAQRPQVDVGFVLSRDSDHNLNASRTLSTSFALADGVRGFLSGGSLVTSDPTRDANRTLGELGLDAAHGRGELTLAAGSRWLDPTAGVARRRNTWRTSLGVRANDRVSAGVGFARSPLDETAVLIGTGLEVDEWTANLDADLGRGVSLSAGGGAAAFSDGNRRSSGLIALMSPVGSLGSAGVLVRALGYESHGVGYFSPDRFTLAEGRATLARTRRAWTGRLNAGLGAQQVGAHAASQLAWRATGEAQFAWAVIDRVVASLGASNSAASSTTGAYRYLSASVALRIGL